MREDLVSICCFPHLECVRLTDEVVGSLSPELLYVAGNVACNTRVALLLSASPRGFA